MVHSDPSSSHSVVIEKAGPRDFLAIAALDRTAWQDTAHSACIPDGEHAWRIWCEHASTYLGRDAQGEVIAALLAFPCAHPSYCLHKIMVAKSHRGQRLGTKLLETLLVDLDAKGSDCFLTVSPTNSHALKLYRAYGFTEEKFVKGYYRENEDRLVLTRRSRKTPSTP